MENSALHALRLSVSNLNHPLNTPVSTLVFACGLPASHLMVIGEAPGAEEEKKGEPFVGRSGQLLEKLLNKSGTSRTGQGAQGHYITNAVNWRPPNNRPPTKTEIELCNPYLFKHIELINPKAILLVGATAAKAVLKKTAPMATLRAENPHQIKLLNGVTVPTFITYHPAYLLRNPAATTLFLEDLATMKSYIK
ncbi:MAG: uracil-DNA glycosylase [Alphaproteobacteria bacterium CG_4_10_14_0_8_um_filter_53_9]|nr:MAG: uracil-DNA glycosylase [Alphaproteobacteria bacterium CG_4_10_14_0_8_um_filter_53_9]